jgi:nitrate/nitrite-specific signal transduction histidine kinase
MNIQTTRIRTFVSFIVIIFVSLIINFNATAVENITAEKAEKAIQQASELRLKSQQLGFEWITVKPFIAQAKKAKEAGELTRALSFANQAIEHASLSIKQAENAEKNWTLAIPK